MLIGKPNLIRALRATKIADFSDRLLALRKGGRQTFFHPILEGRRVHRFIEHFLRDEAGKAETGDQSDGLVMAMRNADAKPLALSAASAFARQIGGSPRFVDEYQLFRIKIELRPKPLLALFQDVRALLFFGMRCLF